LPGPVSGIGLRQGNGHVGGFLVNSRGSFVRDPTSERICWLLLGVVGLSRCRGWADAVRSEVAVSIGPPGSTCGTCEVGQSPGIAVIFFRGNGRACAVQREPGAISEGVARGHGTEDGPDSCPIFLEVIVTPERVRPDLAISRGSVVSRRVRTSPF
jgi:hypothetical protein